MTLHYPLNGTNLDFNRYEHRPLGARDIMVNRLMEDYMTPKRLSRASYRMSFNDSTLSRVKCRDRSVFLDMEVLSKTLHTDHNWPLTIEELRRLYSVPIEIFTRLMNRNVHLLSLQMEILATSKLGLDIRDIFRSTEYSTKLGRFILGLIERHYLESDPSVRMWLKFSHRNRSNAMPKHAPGWKKDMVEHLKGLQFTSRAQHHYSLYSGGHYLSIDAPPNVQFSINPCFVGPSWFSMFRLPFPPDPARKRKAIRKPTCELPLSHIECIHRGRPRRPFSVPPAGSWGSAGLEGLNSSSRQEKWVIYFPRRPLSELDKLSRRRSLSRTHIRAMFTDKPKWHYTEPAGKQAPKATAHPCANCAQYTHHTKHCPSPCGYCNSLSHKASACPVKVTNRCKCQPFPQFHTALECYVRCSRRCGCPYPPSHFKHKNAMLCSYRCCMCGVKGHSGRKCSLKKCPCGEQHLTQDCRWKVECAAKGCNLYLCHLHCRECGKKKDKENKDCFVGKTCQDCLKNGKPVLAKAG
ncbi:hypothetical protein M434DRAFT_242412 [Hypoxylon sp. CO27-5]|nr:hypothetical protein M434DRAFT_242412 [Hypoxylon sp. CO27-5]